MKVTGYGHFAYLSFIVMPDKDSSTHTRTNYLASRLRGVFYSRHYESVRVNRGYSQEYLFRKGGLDWNFEVTGRRIEIKLQDRPCLGTPSDLPPHDRLHALVILTALARVAREHGIELPKFRAGWEWSAQQMGDDKPLALSIRDALEHDSSILDPLMAFNVRWGFTRFKRDPSGWPEDSELYSGQNDGRDADRHRLRPGDVRYLIDRTGRVIRGRVYPNMNNMWRLVTGRRHDPYEHASYFFTPPEGMQLRGRHFGERGKRRREELLKQAVKDEQWSRVAQLAAVLEREKS